MKIKLFTIASILFLTYGCASKTATSSFGMLPDAGSKAKRDHVKDLKMSASLSAELKKRGISNVCAQKVAYYNDSKSTVMLEVHNGACNGKLLNSPVLAAKWHYNVDSNRNFVNSEFKIGGKSIGETASKSDDLAKLCDAGGGASCAISKGANGAQVTLK